MAIKTDNANLPAKIQLRRHFLRKYHAGGPIDVFEACQGSGILWRALSREFPQARVWGVDVKEKKGRLKVDSARIICQPGWTQNVIDIDTYGSPWKHWCGMLPHVTKPLTVFLTIGQWQMGVAKELLRAVGVENLSVPPGIAVKLTDLALQYLLANAYELGLEIVEAIEATAGTHARYIGLRIEPKNNRKIPVDVKLSHLPV